MRDKPYDQPTGGRSSVKSLGQHAIEQRAVTMAGGLKKDHNKVGGYGCTSCAKGRRTDFGVGCVRRRLRGVRRISGRLKPQRSGPHGDGAPLPLRIGLTTP